jgi:antibiotic biosynthesis monooxygenase
MLVHMAFHRDVKPEKEAEMIETMKRFGRAMAGHPGFRQSYSLKDPKTNALVGLAIWDSEAALAAARPAMSQALEGVDFSQLEDSQPEVYLFEIQWAGGDLHHTD